MHQLFHPTVSSPADFRHQISRRSPSKVPQPWERILSGWTILTVSMGPYAMLPW
jgi:hypothetical protein